MTAAVFKNGIFTLPSIKDVKGNIHQRINERYRIRSLTTFMRRSKLNKTTEL